jgi:hypothetical protein
VTEDQIETTAKQIVKYLKNERDSILKTLGLLFPDVKPVTDRVVALLEEARAKREREQEERYKRQREEWRQERIKVVEAELGKLKDPNYNGFDTDSDLLPF